MNKDEWAKVKAERPEIAEAARHLHRLGLVPPPDVVPPSDGEIEAMIRGTERAMEATEGLEERMSDLFGAPRLGLVDELPDGFSEEMPLEDEPFPTW